MTGNDRGDLVVLVPAADEEKALAALLRRHQSLEIRPIRTEFVRHPMRDSGCAKNAEAFLRMQQRNFRHALVVFDHDGSGRESESPDQIIDDLEGRLARSGWDDRAAVVVIAPELEIWLWSDSPRVATSLGWDRSMADLRAWLQDRDLWTAGSDKPTDPKAAMQAVLRETRTPESPAIHARIAAEVGLRRCSDPAFRRLRDILRRWFGVC